MSLNNNSGTGANPLVIATVVLLVLVVGIRLTAMQNKAKSEPVAAARLK